MASKNGLKDILHHVYFETFNTFVESERKGQ